MELEFKKYNDLVIQNWVFEINCTSEFQYCGNINYESERFGNYLGKFEKIALRKKASKIMIELIQNIYSRRHSSIFDRIVVGETEFEMIFLSENVINKGYIPEIVEIINPINELREDKEGIKKYYRNILINTPVPNKGARGLGLIEIVRKSGNGLLYHFTDINDNESLFSLIVRIDLKRDENNTN